MMSSRTRLMYLRLNFHRRDQKQKERNARLARAHNYSDDLKSYLQECKSEPLSKTDAALIDISFLNCSISASTAIIPVRLAPKGKLYDFNELLKINDIDDKDGFLEPNTSRHYFKIHILPARDARQYIIENITERKKQLASQRNIKTDILSFFSPSRSSIPSPDFFNKRKKIQLITNGFLEFDENGFYSINQLIHCIFWSISSKELRDLQTNICNKLKLPRSFLFSNHVSALSEKQIKALCTLLAGINLPIAAPQPTSPTLEEKPLPKKNLKPRL